MNPFLERLCENNNIDSDTFFDMLKEQCGLLKRAFGDDKYKAYIIIIQDAGAEKSRFLKELIQNADDCEYMLGIEPKFKVEINGQNISTESNEHGFTRKNVYAITAIGESTKKRLINNEMDVIGEKGIGFKSIFGVASNVTIHSCREGERFDFSLSSDTPTIPKKESIRLVR